MLERVVPYKPYDYAEAELTIVVGQRAVAIEETYLELLKKSNIQTSESRISEQVTVIDEARKKYRQLLRVYAHRN